MLEFMRSAVLIAGLVALLVLGAMHLHAAGFIAAIAAIVVSLIIQRHADRRAIAARRSGSGPA